MEDYEVRDVFHRAVGPDLEVVFSLQSGTPVQFVAGQEYSEPISLRLTVANRASEPALYTVLMLAINHQLKVVNPSSFTLNTASSDLPAPMYQLNWSVPSRMPFVKGAPLVVTEPSLQVAIPARHAGANQAYTIMCTIVAPGMEHRAFLAALLLSDTTLSLLSGRLELEATPGAITNQEVAQLASSTLGPATTPP